MKNRTTLMNMAAGLWLQLCLILNGLILPQLILRCFGSEANGLVASIHQFLGYSALAEGGMTAVISAALYQPLVQGDNGALSAVLVTARRFYHRIGCLLALYVLLLMVCYPQASGLDPVRTAPLIAILGSSGLISCLFVRTCQVLLAADNKGYVVSLVVSLSTLLGTLFAVLLVRVCPSLLLLVALQALPLLLQPLILKDYVQKHYAIDWGASPDNSLLAQRFNGFAINLAAVIHNSTDIVVLTLFTDLGTVSVYSIYALAITGMKALVLSMTDGIRSVIGLTYAGGRRAGLEEKMDLYEYTIFLLVFVLFGVGSLLLTTFVSLYTRGITDAPYDQPLHGILLILAETFYLSARPNVDLAHSANRFQEISKPACMEPVINLTLSLILVKPLGLMGVAAGTAAAMLFRMVFYASCTEQLMPGRMPVRYFGRFGVFMAGGIFSALLCRFLFPFSGSTFYSWIQYGCLYCALFIGTGAVISLLFFRRELRYIMRYLIPAK